MLAETDAQVLEITGGRAATHAVVPVGAGSIAQAVAVHYKGPGGNGGDAAFWPSSTGKQSHAITVADAAETVQAALPLPRRTAVLAVEADTAACLRASLAVGRRVTVATAETIMCGLNCGTLSETAWPVLRAGVDYSVAVSDRQAHAAVQQLRHPNGADSAVEVRSLGGDETAAPDAVAGGVAAGPCGAATLAGLRKICDEARDLLRLDSDSVVVLFCTEGPRDYAVPRV